MRKLIIALILSTSWFASGQESITFETVLSKTQLGENERLRVSFEMNKDGDYFEAPSFEDFEVLMGPSQSISSSFINGKRSFSKSYTYVLKPLKQGILTIQSASIVIDKKKYETAPQKVTVTQAVTNPNAPKTVQDIADESLYLVAKVSNKDPFINQGVLVTYTLYFSPRVYVNNFLPVENPSYKNFWSQDIPVTEYETRRETFKNESFNAVDLKTVVLYPQKSGPLELEPFALELYVQIPTGRRDFFGDPIMRSATKVVRAGDLVIEVKPLPDDGKPEGFNGAVGNFNLDVKATRLSLDTNESTQVEVEIKGEGNLKLLSIPPLKLPSALETYDPEYSDRVSVNRSGMRGSVKQSYTVVPRYAGSYPVDPLVFTYFDPSSKTYKSLKSDPFTIEVEGESAIGSSNLTSSQDTSTIASATLPNSSPTLAFAPISFRSKWTDSNAPDYFSNWIIWTLIVLIICLGLGSKWLVKLQGPRSSLQKGLEFKRLPKKLKQELRKAVILSANKDPEFYNLAENLLVNGVSNRLRMDIGRLSKSEWILLLKAQGVSDELLAETEKFMDHLNMLRFSPAKPEQYEWDLHVLKRLLNQLNH